MGFSRKEYWSGLPFPPPGDLLDPGIEPMSLAPPSLASKFFTPAPPGKPYSARLGNSKFTSSYKISAASFGIKYFIWWDKMQEIDSLRCQILDPWRLPWSLDQGPGLITQELLCSRVLLKWKRGRESFWHGHQKGMESAPLASLRKGSYILFQLVITISQKNVSRM